MPTIRPNALPLVTSVTAGDVAILDGATVRQITVANLITSAVNLTGPITSVGNTVSIASQTGTGTKFVVDTSPTLVTPVLGVAAATSINKVAFTAPATGSTLTIPDGVTLTGPAVSGTAMTLGNAETVTGVKSFNDGKLSLNGVTSGTTVLKSGGTAGSSVITLPVATDTLVGKATTDTLTNKTLDSAGTGNVLKVSGVTVSSGQYPGEPSTGSATAGNVGEYVTSTIAIGSAVPISNGVAKDVTTISLSAGDWDVWGNVSFEPAGTTTQSANIAWISTVANTLPTRPNGGAYNQQSVAVPAGATMVLNAGMIRLSLSGLTTVSLGALVNFAVSTCGAAGFIGARRRR